MLAHKENVVPSFRLIYALPSPYIRGHVPLSALLPRYDTSHQWVRRVSTKIVKSKCDNYFDCVYSQGYSIFFGLFKPQWQALSEAITSVATRLAENQVATPKRDNEQNEILEEGVASKEDNENNDEFREELSDQYECVLSWVYNYSLGSDCTPFDLLFKGRSALIQEY